MEINSVGDVLHTVQAADAVILFFALMMWWRAGKPMDPTDDDFPNIWLSVFVFAWLGWMALLVLDLVYSLWTRDWFSAGVDALLLLWVWWEFFGGDRWIKKMRKRIKEKVAVIKGRLKVVPVVPVPA